MRLAYTICYVYSVCVWGGGGGDEATYYHYKCRHNAEISELHQLECTKI